MQYFAQYGLFLAKCITFSVLILLTIGGLVSILRSTKQKSPAGQLQIRDVNERLRELADSLNAELLDAAELKRHQADRKKSQKQARKRAK